MYIISDFLKILLSRIKQIISGTVFWACTGCVLLLCFTATGYMDGNTSYSVIETIIRIPVSQYADIPSLSWNSIFTVGLYGYVTLFLPAVASLPYVMTVVMDRRSHMLRMRLMRNQYGPYIAAESAAALVSSGILVTIGYVAYGIITFMIFPHGAGTFTFADIAKVIGGTFWYGMDVSAMALVLSAFVTNEYVIVTVPFMIIYIIGVISNKVFSSTNIPEQVSRIVMAVSPEMLAVIGS